MMPRVLLAAGVIVAVAGVWLMQLDPSGLRERAEPRTPTTSETDVRTADEDSNWTIGVEVRGAEVDAVTIRVLSSATMRSSNVDAVARGKRGFLVTCREAGRYLILAVVEERAAVAEVLLNPVQRHATCVIDFSVVAGVQVSANELRVVDPEGKAVAQLEVRLTADAGRYESRTDAAGVARFMLPVERSSIIATFGGRASSDAPPRLLDPTSQHWEVVIPGRRARRLVLEHVEGALLVRPSVRIHVSGSDLRVVEPEIPGRAPTVTRRYYCSSEEFEQAVVEFVVDDQVIQSSALRSLPEDAMGIRHLGIESPVIELAVGGVEASDYGTDAYLVSRRSGERRVWRVATTLRSVIPISAIRPGDELTIQHPRYASSWVKVTVPRIELQLRRVGKPAFVTVVSKRKGSAIELVEAWGELGQCVTGRVSGDIAVLELLPGPWRLIVRFATTGPGRSVVNRRVLVAGDRMTVALAPPPGSGALVRGAVAEQATVILLGRYHEWVRLDRLAGVSGGFEFELPPGYSTYGVRAEWPDDTATTRSFLLPHEQFLDVGLLSPSRADEFRVRIPKEWDDPIVHGTHDQILKNEWPDLPRDEDGFGVAISRVPGVHWFVAAGVVWRAQRRSGSPTVLEFPALLEREIVVSGPRGSDPERVEVFGLGGATGELEAFLAPATRSRGVWKLKFPDSPAAVVAAGEDWVATYPLTRETNDGTVADDGAPHSLFANADAEVALVLTAVGGKPVHGLGGGPYRVIRQVTCRDGAWRVNIHGDLTCRWMLDSAGLVGPALKAGNETRFDARR